MVFNQCGVDTKWFSNGLCTHERRAGVSLHWGRGALETSENILGKLQALDHFPPNVSTNHIWGTFGM